MSTSTICILVAIVVYMAGIIWIGFACAKKNKNTEDFYLGGRKLGPFVTAMSAEASDMSSWLLMGLPGVAYLTGVADAAWTAIGLAIGTYVNWLIVAKRLRIYTHMSSNSSTIPAFFSNRYRDNERILSVISAIVIVIFFVPYTASGFAACGKLFNSLFGIDYFTAMIISALVIVIYTALGGFLAASTSDFVQSIIMTIAIFVVISYGIISVGGIDKVMDNATSMAGYLSLFKSHNAETGAAVSYNALTVFSTLAWGLGYFGMPHILLRFMAIEDPEKIKLSRRVATIWVVISMAVSIFIGVAGNAMVKEGVIDTLKDPERIIIKIATLISNHGVIAALVAGVILAGILAATMSTADSQLLAASSSVSQNIVKEVLVKDLSAKMSMIIARITLVGIAVIGVIIASNPNSSVFGIVSFAWAGFGAAFGPVMLMALFWKRSNMYGALAGMVSGGIMVFVWKFLIRPLGGLWDIYELLPAFIVSMLFIIIVSLITAAPDKDITDEFDAVCAKMKN
ncbi:MAG: sodium/proline symporter PutP [Lachnospiraceae bacterium]|nr:sodium/proline symporter PutP [Lachnospiraceae bacterium]MDD6856799.1 sodium/proline symporter PutP [Lachnospiraceae bacterium]